ncbi:hypothetical protein QR680_009904 [Steinernema hermaphroditum]|uniref:Uncharacterized protein n=1 Tax=Steinernema hermaphroditum TaxID=289476 RepID=A0AA39MA95_9BILA|nr:hypothetical protein QR680_009904 [Steinernema hermaphroditum]
MAMANVIFSRYYEQLETTYETMRRRMVANYDTLVKLGEKSRAVSDRVRELAEVSYFDLKDQVTNAVVEKNMDAIKADRDIRNTIVELYLGCGVSMLAVCVGLLCGSFTFPYLLSLVFNLATEFALFSALPVYALLKLRKYGDGDGSERRLVVFTMSLTMSTLLGHFLGTKAVNLMPALMFLAPVVLALLVDADYSMMHDFSCDRIKFFIMSGGVAALATLISAFLTGSLALSLLIFTVVHLAWLALHFQLTTAAVKSKSFKMGDYEILYVVGVIIAYGLIGMCTSGTQHEGAAVI